jgi:hypothetical protein
MKLADHTVVLFLAFEEFCKFYWIMAELGIFCFRLWIFSLSNELEHFILIYIFIYFHTGNWTQGLLGKCSNTWAAPPDWGYVFENAFLKKE